MLRKEINLMIMLVSLIFNPSVLSSLGGQQANDLDLAKREKSWENHQLLRKNSPFKNMKWRSLGPAFAGGRIETIFCPKDDPTTIYMGAGSGNLWKSSNNGLTWKPIFENESAFAIGCVAVAPSDQDEIWVGTGEVLMARSSYAGTGVFKSKDGGKNWQNMGLKDTYHIARVLIDSADKNVVYVAAIGHNYSFNKQRGLFKTCDGGKSWEKILYLSENVGCVEVVMNPKDNKTLYAVMWERDRKAWNHVDSGPLSGIYKSTNAGKSWVKLREGLPSGPQVGRIGLAIAPSNPEIIYALVDNHSSRPGGKRRIGGQVFRSLNGGKTWKITHKEYLKTAIGYDFCLIRVSPDDPNQVYVLGNYLLQSTNGGKTFERNQGKTMKIRPHDSKVLHLDHHELWIDPCNPDRLLLGTDGGLYMSYDRGKTWLHLNNLPITEVYAVTVDMADPYNIYIGTQDNAALFGPGNYSLTHMGTEPWRHVYLDPWGGGDSYFTRVKPDNPHIIYYEHQFGELRRKNMKTGKTFKIKPMPAGNQSPLRRNWMTPFLISRTDSNTLYYGANKVFKSTDGGDNWQCISDDLTTKPGKETQGNVPYGTITSISESPLQSGFLVVGTDDGNIHFTDNDGKMWHKVNQSLPKKWVSRVLASAFDKKRLYVAYTGYRDDDFTPYLFTSGDEGKSWQSIAANLPGESINVVREDHRDSDILYVGTDRGVYITLDRGSRWYSLCGNLPTTPVHDLVIHPRDNELVIGTHGRGVYVLDVKDIPFLKIKINRTPAVAKTKKKVPSIVVSGTSPKQRRQSWRKHQALKEVSPFKDLDWQLLGPAVQGGRISSIACSTGPNQAIFLGVGSGNVWKSNNNGTTWKPVFENESTCAIGDIALLPSDPDTVWVGTGEEYIGRNSYSGTGIFKSSDGGKSWKNMGLCDSHHISRVLINPKNPQIVYVAALGHQYSKNRQKGLFKTSDGGKTWKKILYISSTVGVVDVVMDPGNSQTLYAAAWENSGRTPWSFTSHGEKSGIYKTQDGGKTWRKIKEGLPEHKYIGRIGLTISPTNPKVVYLLMDNQSLRSENDSQVIGAEVYRSDNYGENWKKVNKSYLDGLFNTYGYYFGDICVSPGNEDEIYLLGFALFHSKDGGQTYKQLGGPGSTVMHLHPHPGKVVHADNHDLWIDPKSPNRLLLATDGGLYQSYDRGKCWLHINNLPIAEVYALSFDSKKPFNILAGIQDNASLRGPANQAGTDPWEYLWLDPWAGGDGYFTFSDPQDPNIVYYENQFGGLRRKNLKTGMTKYIKPGDSATAEPLRYNWMCPYILSKHQKGTIYFGANKLFKSTDRGDSWRCISPDLTGKPAPGKWGSFPESPHGKFYGTISSIYESPLKKGLLFTGSDDGYLHKTEDDGINWQFIGKELPRQWISRVVASRFDVQTVYVAQTGYREDNFDSYLFLSTDSGAHWRSIVGNLPEESINVLREDPKNKNILYIGTDMGVYVTLNRGKKWFSLCNNLPTTPVHDLLIHPQENIMVIGTHGRSCYILDVTPIQKKAQ